jgi:hypothetical protein
MTTSTTSELHFTSLELHITRCSTFVRRFGKKVKAAGGKYSSARGYGSYRFVNIPVHETQLIVDVLNEYQTLRKTTVVCRGYGFLTRNCVLSLEGRDRDTSLNHTFTVEALTERLAAASAANDDLAAAHLAEQEKAEQDRVAKEEAEAEAWDAFLSLTPEQIRTHLSPQTVASIVSETNG